MFAKPQHTLGLCLAIVVAMFVLYVPFVAKPGAQSLAPGGFVESDFDNVARPLQSASQIQGYMPARGRFTFPAPYNTLGVRLTNASDCGGSADCLQYIGYSYWRNINNHVGSDTMLVMLGLDRNKGGGGPTLFSYNKITGEVRNLGPIFDASSPYSWASAEGYYFSATRPNTIYLHSGSREMRYDVITKAIETVFDAATQFGSDKIIWQVHSSNDDRVHSFTLKSNVTYQALGCGVYLEATGQYKYFPARGDFDECQIDKSGRYLVIKENVDGSAGEDNVIEDLQAGTEQTLIDQNGAGGHSDAGFGYIVAEDNFYSQPGALRLWRYDVPLTDHSNGQLVFQGTSWAFGTLHVAHSNAVATATKPISQQYACGSNANRQALPRANEVICYMLDGQLKTVVVAPVMVNLDASGGGSDDYSKLPKGNLDVTGQYFIWSANLGSGRLDAFIVHIPTGLLGGTGGGTGGDTTAPSVAITTPTGGATVSGNVTVQASATDNVGVAGVQFKLDGVALGPEITSTPYGVIWDSTQTPAGTHALTASARDAAGNVKTSTSVSVTVGAAQPPPPQSITISAVSAAPSSTSATITWQTSGPADSQVEFGLTTAYGSSTSLDANAVTSHSQTISGLSPSTTYQYRVKSRPAGGTLVTSANFSFTTQASAPVSGGDTGFVWRQITNSTVSGSRLTKTSGCDGCPDAGAVGSQSIGAGDGWFEVVVPATGPMLSAGFVTGTTWAPESSMPFALRFQAGRAEVRERSAYKVDVAFAAGDKFRVAVSSGRVIYSKNGTPFYTSTGAPAYPLLPEVVLNNAGAAVDSPSYAPMVALMPGKGKKK